MKKRLVMFSPVDYNRVLGLLGRRETVIHERLPEKNQLVVETTPEVFAELSDACDKGIGAIPA